MRHLAKSLCPNRERLRPFFRKSQQAAGYGPQAARRSGGQADLRSALAAPPPGLRPEPSFPALPAQLFFFSSAVCSAGASACGLPLRLTFGSFPAFWARRTNRSTNQTTTARMTAHSSTSGR